MERRACPLRDVQGHRKQGKPEKLVDREWGDVTTEYDVGFWIRTKERKRTLVGRLVNKLEFHLKNDLKHGQQHRTQRRGQALQ